MGGKKLRIRQVYKVERRDARERLTSYFEDGSSQKHICLSKYNLAGGTKVNNLNFSKDDFKSKILIARQKRI